MITFKTGDIFTSDAGYLVNPTNFQGPMGGGLARKFADRFRGLETEYRRVCENKKFGLMVRTFDYFAVWRAPNGQRVICFPTMQLGEPSKLEYIKTGCEKLAKWLSSMPPETSIAFPKLGCGIGGLDWSDVRTAIIEAFDNIDGLTVEVWE